MLSRAAKLFSGAFLLAGVAFATPAAAQRPVELGLDGTISRTSSDGGDFTRISIPVSRVRAGFYLSDLMSLEPSLSFDYFDTDFGSLTTAAFGVGLLYHFNGDRARTRPFVEGHARLNFIDDGDESATQAAFGGGLGLKVPMSDRFDMRLEGFVEQALETDEFFSATTFGVLFGFSFYTR